MMVLGLLATLALSQPTLGDCSRIDASIERLACYDQLAGRIESVQAAANAGSVLEAPKSQEQLRKEFEEKARLIKSGEKPSIVSDIAEIEVSKMDHVTITLENGQVWKQLKSNSPIHINSKKPPKTATITEGAMGSYRLKFDNQRRSIRVRRIK